MAFIELRKGKSSTVLCKGVTIILVDIPLHGYVKSETSEGRMNAGRGVGKPSKWSRQEMIVA